MATPCERLELVAARTPGCGNSETSRYTLATERAQDRRAYMAGNFPALIYTSLATGETPAATKQRLLREMAFPCGLPPTRPEFPNQAIINEELNNVSNDAQE